MQPERSEIRLHDIEVDTSSDKIAARNGEYDVRFRNSPQRSTVVTLNEAELRLLATRIQSRLELIENGRSVRRAY
jgi:hypothetical protein